MQAHSGNSNAEILNGIVEITYIHPLSQCPHSLIGKYHANQYRDGDTSETLCGPTGSNGEQYVRISLCATQEVLEEAKERIAQSLKAMER